MKNVRETREQYRIYNVVVSYVIDGVVCKFYGYAAYRRMEDKALSNAQQNNSRVPENSVVFTILPLMLHFCC